MKSYISKVLVVTWLLLVALSLTSFYSGAATVNDFTNANSAIDSAYLATHKAEKSGGNVTVQINELNTAIALIEKAQAENSTQPAQALLDLDNATQIAILVSNQSSSIADAGASATQMRNTLSVGSAIVIIVAAAMIYLYGGRIYRRVWLYLYKNYVVKPSG